MLRLATGTSRIKYARAGILAAALAIAAAAAQPAAATVTCDRVASPTGSDSAAGTVDAPFRSAQKLADSLGAGQTGCLRQGSYAGGVRFGHGGAAGAPLTLTSYPGEHGTVQGRVEIPDGTAFVTVSGLTLDRSTAPATLPSPTVNGDDVTFTGNDVVDTHTGICFNVGSDNGYGHASRVVIQANRIHGCGKLPAANHDHGIYVDESDHVTIAWNLIYGNADRGVQLYPDAQYTTIVHNVIDGNGEGVLFSGDFGLASSNTTVADNAITNAQVRANVESWYPTGNPKGTANSVTDNCISGGAVDTSGGGFTAANNLGADPGYANRSAGDFTMAPGSSCATLVGDVAGTVAAALNGQPAATPVTTTTATPTPTTTPTTTTGTTTTTTTTSPKKKGGHQAHAASVRIAQHATKKSRRRARSRRHGRRHALARLHRTQLVLQRRPR